MLNCAVMFGQHDLHATSLITMTKALLRQIHGQDIMVKMIKYKKRLFHKVAVKRLRFALIPD